MAEGVFRTLLERTGLQERVTVDSAGTLGYHRGEAPDARGQAVSQARGYDLSGQRARQVTPEDCARFDYLIAMDGGHVRQLRSMCADRDKVRRLLEFAQGVREREVPDPYHGGERDFERVLDLVEVGCQGLLAEIREHLEVA